MPSTYTLISSNVLSTTAASVTFSAIPSTYTDLVLSISARSDYAGANDQIKLQLNTDTSTNYSMTRLYGDGANAASTANSNQSPTFLGYFSGGGSTSNTFGSTSIYLPSYAVSQNKPISVHSVMETNATTAFMNVTASLWRNTAAVNQIVMTTLNAANFVSGSSFYLYGIKNS
jgi:hypothetical protein